MKKFICLLLVLSVVLLCGCGAQEEPVDYGSFTMDKSYSHDEKYCIRLETFVNNEGEKVTSVDVYNADTEIIVPALNVFSADEFYGYCWEKDEYNFWVQLNTGEIRCYSYIDLTWKLNENAELPDYIKTAPGLKITKAPTTATPTTTTTDAPSTDASTTQVTEKAS